MKLDNLGFQWQYLFLFTNQIVLVTAEKSNNKTKLEDRVNKIWKLKAGEKQWL